MPENETQMPFHKKYCLTPPLSSVQDGEVTIVMQWCTRLMKSSECICTYTTMIGKVSILPDILLASNIN